MKIVSVINYKGGVGKTTLTANLAAELARRGKRVLLLDFDPQASLTFSFVTPDFWEKNLAEEKTIKAWFDSLDEPNPANLSSLIHTPSRVNKYFRKNGKLDLIPSHLGLLNVDLELATQLGGASMRQAKKNYLRVHRRLADGLSQMDQDRYDLVLIDCPPNFNIVTKNAIVACDGVMTPAKADYLSTLGIDYLIKHMNQLAEDYNEYIKVDGDEGLISPELFGVVFTMVQEYSGGPLQTQSQFMAQVRRTGVSVFTSYIKENKTLFGDAPQYGIPVVLGQAGGSSTTAQKVVSGLQGVTYEFEKVVAL